MITIKRLDSLLPDEAKSHHIGNPPTGFSNPWPSFTTRPRSALTFFKVRFARDRPAFVPVPDRTELVPVRQVDFSNTEAGPKVTWIGHASFLLQTSTPPGACRGINILCDPVFAERTSPVKFAGPKRYTPTPCTLQELTDSVEVDLIVISHNHYDHADAETLRYIYSRQEGNVHFLTGLNNARWLTSLGITPAAITELDWWERVDVNVERIGSVRITCTPSQHFSARSLFDHNQDLWCSYAIEEVSVDGKPKKIYFAGDTGYRSVPQPHMSREEEDALPVCPAFKQVGELLGPFDLALLPIGLCSPRDFMSQVHTNAWDSVRIHQDIKSKKSIGMHWGAVRGGISQEYEDVRTPPKHWKMACEEAGLKWGEDIGLMDVGETLILG